MNTIVINKDNTIPAFQKILKLISSGKRLRVEEIKEDYNPKIQKSLDRALKEYKRGEFKTLLTVD